MGAAAANLLGEYDVPPFLLSLCGAPGQNSLGTACAVEETGPLSCCTLGQDMVGVSWSSGSSNRRLEELYEFDKSAKPIGKGGFSMVYLAKLRSDPGKRVAVKMMDKTRLQHIKAPPDMVFNEVEMMRECSGRECRDRFVQLFDFIETSSKYCLVLEYCGAGTLEDASTFSAEGLLGETQVRGLMQQILEAASFLHSRTICHRDIKPHNLFIVGCKSSRAMRAQSVDSQILSELIEKPRLDEKLYRAKSEEFWPLRAPEASQLAVGQHMRMLQVKLGDFGTAIKIQPGQLCKDKVGTPAFMAPEMHLLPGRSPGYDHKVDVWATGVVMVFLLANQYPFLDGSGRLLRDKLVMGDVPLWETGLFQEMFAGIQEAVGMRRKRPSKISRDLALRLLAPAARQRISPFYALQHCWFTSPLPGEGVDHEPPPPSILDWQEFESSLSTVKRDLQWAMDMFSGSLGNQIDDPLKTCVVCYNAAGNVGYICPQCHHAVCAQCLGRLPKAACPYCRLEAPRIAAAQQAASPMLEAPRPSAVASFPAYAHVVGTKQPIATLDPARASSVPRERYWLTHSR